MHILRMNFAITFIVAIVLAQTSIGFSAELRGSAKHCTMPSDFSISDGMNLSPELKKFLGFFSGFWDDKLHHTLVVSDVTPEGKANVFYAYDTYADWSINQPDCSRHQAKIEDGVLTIETVAGGEALVKYQFTDGDTLEATYDRDNRVTPGAFKRE